MESSEYLGEQIAAPMAQPNCRSGTAAVDFQALDIGASCEEGAEIRHSRAVVFHMQTPCVFFSPSRRQLLALELAIVKEGLHLQSLDVGRVYLWIARKGSIADVVEVVRSNGKVG
jgi:hypothetical protein